MEELINESYFRSLTELENTKNLDVSGLYAIRIKSASLFPELIRTELIKRNTNLVYIGKADQSIRKRLYQECRGKGHGTFFRGIGAILDYLPPQGSLVNKKNQNNYRFSADDREKITNWMNENLKFNFVESNEEISEVEQDLIKKHTPIFNSRHNPQKFEYLVKRRKECRNYALQDAN